MEHMQLHHREFTANLIFHLAGIAIRLSYVFYQKVLYIKYPLNRSLH